MGNPSLRLSEVLWTSPIRQYSSTKCFDAEQCFQLVVSNILTWGLFVQSDLVYLVRVVQETTAGFFRDCSAVVKDFIN